MIWPFSKRRSESAPPEVQKIFEKMERLLSNEDAQNERYPEDLRRIIQNNPSVDLIPGSSGEFGLTPSNPIPVNGPLGELFYLCSLRREPDEKIAFHRRGSQEQIDAYEIISFESRRKDILFFSMYYPRKSSRSPRGYFLKPAQRTEARFLRGVNFTHPNFPTGLYPATVEFANKTFGMTLVDPELRTFDAKE